MLHLTTKLPIISYEMFHFHNKQRLSHSHSRFLCLLTGKLTIEIHTAHHEMTNGDIFFLHAEEAYDIEATEPSLILYLCLHPYLLLNTFGQARPPIYPFYSDALLEQKSSLNKYIADLITLCIREDTDSCGIYAKAYELLHYLSRYCMTLKTSAPASSSATALASTSSSKIQTKLTQLKYYLEKHYTEAITLNDAAAALDYTPQYLSSFLKKNLNMTFQEYLNTFRLNAAIILLRSSEEPDNKIAFLCGFPNQSSFLKSFEHAYSKTPEEYRQNHRSNYEAPKQLAGIPITNPALTLDYIFNYMNYTTRPIPSHTDALSEEVTISDWSSAPLPQLWNFLINMGTARDFDKPTFRHHISFVQNGLHFQYGRCTEIFSLAKIYTFNNEKTYDFSRIFRLIDFMRSIHLKPFFDIDNKPFRLYKAPEHEHSDYSTYLGTKEYDDFFFEILPEFVKESIFRYGFDEFSTWKFELWRRYNVNMSSLESPEDFCARFQKTARILKTLVPNAVLGGPGFNGFLSTDKFADLIAPFKKAAYKPDFISAYYFPYAVISGDNADDPSGYTVSPTPYTMVCKLSEWKEMLSAQGFGNTPFYITEYSAHVSLENYINDSTYSAIYIFHQCIQNLHNTDGLGYWLATDLSLDYGKPNSPLFGGNGLITKNSIRKPSYYAHHFLNHLGSRLIQHTEHSIVTTAEDGSIRILLYHFGILNQSFVDSPFNQGLLDYSYSAFEDSKPLEFTLSFSNIPKGLYRIKEYSLNLNAGNVLSTWAQLNHSTYIGADEIQYMESRSIPAMKIHMEHFANSHTLHVTSDYNEARLIILHPNT